MAANLRRGSSDLSEGRKLSVKEASFYAAIYSSARKGSLAELRRKCCSEEEAEEIFTAAFERVMETVDPIAREFSEAQMVSYVKRACWFRLLDERRRRGLRAEIGLGAIRSLGDSNTPGPEEIAEEREAAAIGREALQMLPERDRLIFRQRHQINLSPEEILQNMPGLSLRTYRKIIGRANARVLDAFARIQGGERCEEMRANLLRRYVADESPEPERRAVEAHLAHCRACRQTQAQMRGYLLDVASGLLAASSLSESSRGLRERLREAFLRFTVGLPASGGDATAGQALSATSIKVASTCAGLAASACLAAGVVPGIQGIGLLTHKGQGMEPSARSARHLVRPSERPTLINALLGTPATTAAGTEKPGRSKDERAHNRTTQPAAEPAMSSAHPVSPVSSSTSDARVSGRQTGTEVGAESGGQPLPATPTLAPSNSPNESRSGSSAAENGPRASPEIGGESGSEFGM